MKIGKTVFFRLSLTLGSSSVVGTTPQFTPPVAAVSYGNTQTNIGWARLENVGVQSYFGGIEALGATAFVLTATKSDSTYVNVVGLTSSVPFVWVTGSLIMLEGFYEAA